MWNGFCLWSSRTPWMKLKVSGSVSGSSLNTLLLVWQGFLFEAILSFDKLLKFSMFIHLHIIGLMVNLAKDYNWLSKHKQGRVGALAWKNPGFEKLCHAVKNPRWETLLYPRSIATISYLKFISTSKVWCYTMYWVITTGICTIEIISVLFSNLDDGCALDCARLRTYRDQPIR